MAYDSNKDHGRADYNQHRQLTIDEKEAVVSQEPVEASTDVAHADLRYAQLVHVVGATSTASTEQVVEATYDKVVLVDGADTYTGIAPAGSIQIDSVWRIFKTNAHGSRAFADGLITFNLSFSDGVDALAFLKATYSFDNAPTIV